MIGQFVSIDIGEVLNVKLDYLTKFQRNLCKFFKIIPESRYDSYLEVKIKQESFYFILGDIFMTESGQKFIALNKDGKLYLKTLNWRTSPMKKRDFSLFYKKCDSLVEKTYDIFYI